MDPAATNPYTRVQRHSRRFRALTAQPRLVAGTRHGGEPAGGQFASKGAPTTAAAQLTTGLFDGVPTNKREQTQNYALSLFNTATPHNNTDRWDEHHRDRLRGFINTIEALQP